MSVVSEADRLPLPPRHWDDAQVRAMQGALRAWFARHQRRHLPFRRTRDPYAIWVSELMLQQTQVERVVPFYERWLRRFPDLASLARAPWPAVLAAWRGLGYYHRARHLHEAARWLVRAGGAFPREAAALRALPGVGRYTAGAVACFAFNRPEPCLDVNAGRVLVRAFARRAQAIPRNFGEPWWELARRLIPPRRARRFNQALMELGALVCTARAPACGRCPWARWCAAHTGGWATRTVAPPRPRRPSAAAQARRAGKPLLCVAVAVVRDGRRFLVQRRPKGPYRGWWEFPGGKREPGEDDRRCLKRELAEELGVEVAVGRRWDQLVYEYPDRVVHLRFHRTRIVRGRPTGREGQALRWVTSDAFDRLRMLPSNEPFYRRLQREWPAPDGDAATDCLGARQAVTAACKKPGKNEETPVTLSARAYTWVTSASRTAPPL